MSTIQAISQEIREHPNRYKTSDLERLMMNLQSELAARKAKNKQYQEKRLLQQLNECVLPEGHLEHFFALKEKRKEQGISQQEEKELFGYIKEDHILQTKRLKILKKLADLQKISVVSLMKKLELNLPANV